MADAMGIGRPIGNPAAPACGGRLWTTKGDPARRTSRRNLVFFLWMGIMPMPLTVILLAAGQSTRMRSSRPKILHPLAGRVPHRRRT